MTESQKTKIKELLVKAGIPHHEISVIGLDVLFVHIKCKGHSTAKKWMAILNKMQPHRKAIITDTAWHANVNKGSALNPTLVKGYLVGFEIK